MNWLGAVLTVCVLVSSARCDSDAIPWCYHQPSCSDSTWSTIATRFCNGTRQSPIDIVSGSAQSDSSLTAFKFDNYDITTALKSITNTGKTVKVNFNSNIKISGGGLSEDYDSLQFHLHWGNGASVPGSEHTVNGKRYPMELHIVNSKASFNGNTALAVADGTGLAALGFLIEEMAGDATGQPASWKKLTTYLANITNSGESVSLSAAGISLDDLLPGVNRSSYYRYLGSLTTPSCNEAVVWTVFKDKVQVSKDLIDLFSTTLRVSNTTEPIIINNFRRIQPAQSVTQTSSTTKTCYSLGLMALSILLARL